MAIMEIGLNLKTIWTVSEEYVDLAFDFYQAYANHHDFSRRRSWTEKCTKVHMDNESGYWYIAYFLNEHNHSALDLRFASMLPSHWKISEEDIEQMNEMRKRAFPYHECRVFWDMYNVNTKQRRNGSLDVDSCLRYLRECKANDLAFYYKEVVDWNSVFQHLFWCDGTSENDYQIFGDVVVFDATYKKNVYLSHLVVFSGVNHHNQTVVFTAALVADEKEETYVWLLQQLQVAMRAKVPVSIITDGDRKMKSAIEQVFPERKWFEMVEQFGVCDKRWIHNMYERRHSCATAHISYTDFLCYYHRFLMFVRAKEVEADFECVKGDPMMTTNLKYLERCAVENYTQSIFYLFVSILDRAYVMRVIDSKVPGSYFIHTVSRYGTSKKDWHVVASYEMTELRCTFMRMECFGISCEYIIAVLVLNNVHEISKSLILPRWTKVAKMGAVELTGIIWDSL
ncbi:protein FAR1-RELATED SEQUENCE 5-like [Arachis stenosperma]|uniref:protein FAR1-RELATED SEQUENCE 5-like n=1 Tax=Arachis stenosperma TaxID=217475 RepID=UPI0025ABAE98|nr:protein FAR1-RELATED SEQUENCE 5-like [Arachis stenosperma]